jgi:hypothetical protein
MYRSRRKREQPTSRAELTIVRRPFTLDDPVNDQDEQPTRYAQLTIHTWPLPPADPFQPGQPEATV